MKKLIIVSDWANDSLACQEVRSVIEGFLDNPSSPNITFLSSSVSSIHTAFIINQIVETEERYGRPLDTVLFQGSDPVESESENSVKTWSDLFIIRLKSGLHIIGPNAGDVFSLIKPKIDAVFYYPGLAATGSFRARDVFARIVAHLMDSKQDDLDLEETHTNLIPQVEDYYVGHIDNFGNIITTIAESVLEENHTYGDKITVTINGITKTALYSKSLFDESSEGLIIYPGTTGNPDDPYLEISKYADFAQNATTGMNEFNNPKPGMEIQVG